MRFVAGVGVKDEVGLIDRIVAHLRAIGIDHIVACDMYSTDGTYEALERHAGHGDVTVIRMSDQESQEAWSQANLAAVRRAGADWVLFIDADEFPLPASGSIRDCVTGADADVLKVDRYNTPIGPDGEYMPVDVSADRYDDLLLITRFIPRFWTHLEENPSASWMRKQLAGRAVARVESIGSLPLGVHDVEPAPGRPLRRANADDLLVAHLPFTTRERFARKVENIRVLLASHDELFGERYGLHWRRWVELADQGVLDDEFGRMVFDRSLLDELRKKGAVRSAAEIFAERLQSPVA